jgi:hypothetical protein
VKIIGKTEKGYIVEISEEELGREHFAGDRVMLLGRTKWSKTETDLRAGRYANGSLALYTIDGEGEVALKLTVNLEGVAPVPPEGHVWLKGWSENKGVPQAVETAGIAELTGLRFKVNHDAYAELAKLSPAILAWLEGEDTDGC